MSVLGHQPAGDQMQPSNVFSYAQAAKGRSQPQALTRLSSKEESGGINTSTEPSQASTTAEGSRNGEDTSVSRPPLEKSSSPEENGVASEVEQPLSVQVPASQEKASTSPRPDPTDTSEQSTPLKNAPSASTTTNHDDGPAVTNIACELPIEKANQPSATEEELRDTTQALEAPQSDKPQSTSSSQADDPAKGPPAVLLKEAPPPAVNIWQQRMAQTQATSKPKPRAPPAQPQADQTNSPSDTKGNGVNVPEASAPAQDDARKPDARRRGKNVVGEERVNGGMLKEQRRPFESERGNTKAGRMSETRNESRRINPPPPPNDAISWPTPDSAQDEEKRRVYEKADKPDKEKPAATKVHGNQKWIPVQHVPSAVFNTPIPPSARRGGRPARGGRESNPRTGAPIQTAAGSERPGITTHQVPMPLNGGAVGRERFETQLNRGDAVDARGRRASSAGAIATKDRRKYPDGSMPEGAKDSSTATGPGISDRAVSTSDAQKQLLDDPQPNHQNALRGRHAADNRFGQPLEKTAPTAADRYEKRNSISHETYNYSRGSGAERRSEYQGRPSNQPGQFGQASIRERGESRPERSRGGSYRGGRGGNNHGVSNASNGHGQAFMNGTFPAHTSVGQPSTRYNSDSYHQMPQSAVLPPASSHHRGHRPNSRSNSMQHGAPYGRYPSNPASAGPHLSNIQTELANMYGQYPGNQVAMSAMPYSAYTDPMALCNMVSMQMEYYLSLENLCKDMFLRKHMDSQGFILLGVLTNFNRIRSLTQDLEIIRMACSQSSEIEFGTGPDGLDRVRKRDEWQRWVLNLEERDPTARNDGPVELRPGNTYVPPAFQAPYGYNIRQVESARLAPANSRMDDIPFPMQHDLPGPSYPVRPTAGASLDTSSTPKPLSAAVAEFSPQKPGPIRRSLSTENEVTNGLTNGGTNGAANGVSRPEELGDLQTANLVLIFKNPGPSDRQSQGQLSISNGSPESKVAPGESNKLDKRPAIPLINGSVPADASGASNASKSPTPRLASPRQTINHPSVEDTPVRWRTDAKLPVDLPTNMGQARYNDLRKKALDQHKDVKGGNLTHDMDILYCFWSHYLVMNFDKRMYAEFRQLAFVDQDKGSEFGISQLHDFYDQSMNIKEPFVVSDEVATDFLDLIKRESSSGERRAYQILRKYWRNGAWSMRNRSKITKLIDSNLAKKLDS